MTGRGLPDVPCVPYDTIRPQLRSGDILLCSGSAVFSRLIQSATNSPWSHVGFVMKAIRVDRMILMESVEDIGVRAVSLRTYVQDYNGSGKSYGGRMFIGRHADVNLDDEHPDKSLQFFQGALDLLGYPYDRDEIISIAARVAGSRLGREYDEIRQNRAFICSEFVHTCFARIGVDIPYDRRGFIAPADFAACPSITVLWEIARPA